jgi:hypothetical protein
MISTPPFVRLVRRGLALSAWFAAAVAVFAHDPFDISSRLVVYADRLEMKSTLGADAARQLLARAGLTPQEISNSLRALDPDHVVAQPIAVADQAFELSHDRTRLPAQKVTTRSEGMEVVFTITYTRPEGGPLEILAAAYSRVPELRTGSLIVLLDPDKTLAGALLSSKQPALQVTLPSLTATGGP